MIFRQFTAEYCFKYDSLWEDILVIKYCIKYY